MTDSIPKTKPEIYVMVDVETSGSIPGDYSLLSLGAVVVGQHRPPFQKDFYCEMKPLPKAGVDLEAMKVNGLDIDMLKVTGSDPTVALERLRNFVVKVANPEVVSPVMVSNGTFDYMWVTWYFKHFGVRSPFGPNSLDMKSLHFGRARCKWSQTRGAIIGKIYASDIENKNKHNALDDALYQAEIFERMLKA